MEFDHSNPADKTYDISKLWTKPQKVIEEELAKCVLLCETCHKKKSAEERSVAHGRGKAGKRDCPCTECKARKSEYMKNYHATHVRKRDRTG